MPLYKKALIGIGNPKDALHQRTLEIQARQNLAQVLGKQLLRSGTFVGAHYRDGNTSHCFEKRKETKAQIKIHPSSFSIQPF